MQKVRTLLFLLWVLSFLAVSRDFFVSTASAQIPGEGLTLSPPIVEITGNPGDTLEQKVRVTNPTDKIMEVYPVVMNFRAGTDGSGEPSFYPVSEEDSKYALGNWIYFDQPKIALTPQQVVEFTYEIRVPFDAEPGGHYGTLLFSTQAPKADANQSQVSIASMVGSLILVKIPGDVRENGKIDEFTSRRFYFAPPVDLSARVKNVGNIHFKPRGEIVIRNIFGSEKAKLEFNEQKGNILPDSSRIFANTWDPEYRYFFELPVGKFTAHLHVTYGAEEKVLDQAISFWMIPWWIIIAVGTFLGLIFLLCIWWIVRRRRRRKKQNKASTPITPPVQRERALTEMPMNERPRQGAGPMGAMPGQRPMPPRMPRPYSEKFQPPKRRRKIV